MKKMKVVDKFVAIKSLLNGEPAEMSVADALVFLDERIAITEKKNASGSGADRKPTKTQQENEGVKAVILEVLGNANKSMTILDLQKNSVELAEFSNQKISALLTQLIKANVVVRTEVKGKAHFALAKQE